MLAAADEGRNGKRFGSYEVAASLIPANPYGADLRPQGVARFALPLSPWYCACVVTKRLLRSMGRHFRQGGNGDELLRSPPGSCGVERVGGNRHVAGVGGLRTSGRQQARRRRRRGLDRGRCRAEGSGRGRPDPGEPGQGRAGACAPGGGSAAGYCRSAFRFGDVPGLRYDCLGLRVAFAPAVQQ